MFFSLPQYNIIEKGAISKLKGLLIDLKIEKPLVITSKNLMQYCQYGDIFFDKNIDIDFFQPSLFSNYDGIIGFGGGRILDKARYISYKLKLPFISFASSLSTDAMASSTVSLGGNSIFAKNPNAVIIDLNIINESPKKLSLAGYGDLMAKISANLDWKLAYKEKNDLYNEDISQFASGLAHSMLNFVLDNDFDLKIFNQKLAKFLFFSGLLTSVTKSSRPISGAEHTFEKALLNNKNIKTKALHGEIVGVSTLLFTHLHELENPEIKGMTEKIKTSYKKIGFPTSFKKIGINFDNTLESLLTAHKVRNRYTILRNGLDKQVATDALNRFMK